MKRNTSTLRAAEKNVGKTLSVHIQKAEKQISTKDRKLTQETWKNKKESYSLF